MIKTLKTQHRTIIQMSFNGFTNREIAERTGKTESTISIILRSPLGQAYLNGLHDTAKENTLDVRKKLISMNASALDAFDRILKPTSKAPYNVQFSTAKDILDRNGFKPTDKINIDMTLAAKSDEEIDAEINALAKSIAANTSKLEAIECPNKPLDEESAELTDLTEITESDINLENPDEVTKSNVSLSSDEQDEQLQSDDLADALVTKFPERAFVDCFPPK